MNSKEFKISLIQNQIYLSKKDTLNEISNLILEACSKKVSMIFLGECFNTIYGKDFLIENAEDFSLISQEPTLSLLSKLAIENQIYIFGNIPEKEAKSEKIYNTAFCLNKKGEIIAKHRKMHLFDVDIPGKITHKDSDTFLPGNEITVCETEYCKIGIGICYDIRFPELSLLMTEKGAQVLYYPSAFNQTTGPLHWEILLRTRALDSQVYLVAVSPARFFDNPNYYQAWGHSSLIDPMGRILTTCEQNPIILYGSINLDMEEETRRNLPYLKQKRNDIYRVEDISKK